jgi:hypothetical protein
VCFSRIALASAVKALSIDTSTRRFSSGEAPLTRSVMYSAIR